MSKDLKSGTPLIYYGALGTAVANLTDGTTYFVIQDAANPRLMRLTTAGAAQAIAAAQAGAAVAASGEDATAAAIDSVRVGNPPAVGTFPVTVDTIGETIDFGFDAGFATNQPLVYEGPAAGSQGINGLTPGNIYRITLPDRVNHPGMVQLVDSSGNIVPVSLASGTTTSVMFGTPTSDNVSVSSATITFDNPEDPSTPFDPGLKTGDPFVYLGPVSPPSDAGITGLTPDTVYYVITTNTPGVIALASTYQNATAVHPVSIFPLTSRPTTTNINYTVPFAPRIRAAGGHAVRGHQHFGDVVPESLHLLAYHPDSCGEPRRQHHGDADRLRELVRQQRGRGHPSVAGLCPQA